MVQYYIICMTKFAILIQKAWIAEGGYSVQCLEIPAAISQDEDIENLKDNMKKAIERALETIKKSKKDAFVEEIEITI